MSPDSVLYVQNSSAPVHFGHGTVTDKKSRLSRDVLALFLFLEKSGFIRGIMMVNNYTVGFLESLSEESGK